jgi:hypothetical protein
MASPFTNKLMKELLENVRVAIKNSLKNADVLEFACQAKLPFRS